MSKGFDDIIKKIEELKKTHKKKVLESIKVEVRQKFNRLTQELEDEADFSIWEKENGIDITITAKSFITCDEAHSLNELINLANFMQIENIENKIKIKLWFRIWEWVKIEGEN